MICPILYDIRAAFMIRNTPCFNGLILISPTFDTSFIKFYGTYSPYWGPTSSSPNRAFVLKTSKACFAAKK